MAKSLNKVQLIGNLTRDPELRYTPNGAAVCTFGLATNRTWTTDTGEKHEEADFHNVVAWNKLAEICSQLLVKGRKAYVEGRLSTRSWTGQDGQPKSRTEVVIDDMIILDSKGTGSQPSAAHESDMPDDEEKPVKKTVATADTEKKKVEAPRAEAGDDEVAPEDIPF